MTISKEELEEKQKAFLEAKQKYKEEKAQRKQEREDERRKRAEKLEVLHADMKAVQKLIYSWNRMGNKAKIEFDIEAKIMKELNAVPRTEATVPPESDTDGTNKTE